MAGIKYGLTAKYMQMNLIIPEAFRQELNTMLFRWITLNAQAMMR